MNYARINALMRLGPRGAKEMARPTVIFLSADLEFFADRILRLCCRKANGRMPLNELAQEEPGQRWQHHLALGSASHPSAAMPAHEVSR